MTQFRPCIDLHQGKVKQIVGGTLSTDETKLITNFTAERPSSWYAKRFFSDALTGGHVIMLGPGNESAAEEALQSWPNGLQIGGGIHLKNAAFWLKKGASHIIVTSWLIPGPTLSLKRLAALSSEVGKENLVLDLSCRTKGERWFIAKDRWQTITQTEVNPELIIHLTQYCDEFLIHAADVEGRCQGIDEALVAMLAKSSCIPVTYAGGARSISDLHKVNELSRGKVDLTIGSALDIFGGSLVKYSDCVAYNHNIL